MGCPEFISCLRHVLSLRVVFIYTEGCFVSTKLFQTMSLPSFHTSGIQSLERNFRLFEQPVPMKATSGGAERRQTEARMLLTRWSTHPWLLIPRGAIDVNWLAFVKRFTSGSELSFSLSARVDWRRLGCGRLACGCCSWQEQVQTTGCPTIYEGDTQLLYTDTRVTDSSD